MWNVLSNLVFSLWGAIALGFMAFGGAVAWQLVKISRGARGGDLGDIPADDEDLV